MSKEWTCEDCGESLATVVDGIGSVLDGCKVELRFRTVIVTCPRCGKTNVWKLAEQQRK